MSFENDKVAKPMPRKVMEELLASFFLSAAAYMDFRLSPNHIATCSDASETGGGLCQSVGLTHFGSQAAESLVRGEFPESGVQGGVLGISVCGGVGSSRVALDSIGVPMFGFISIESGENAQRVIESFFPSARIY